MCQEFTNKKTGETIKSQFGSTIEAVAFLESKDPNVLDKGWLGFWIHKLAMEAKNQSNKLTNGFEAINAMFATAMENGRKRPEIRVVFAETMFRIYLPKSGSGNICIKTATKKKTSDGRLDFGEAEFICSINKETNKVWQPRELKERGFTYPEQLFFKFLEADPVKFLSECGKGLGWCCYCGKRLEDDRAIYNGYGHTCSKRYNLDWKKVPTEWKERTIENGSEALNKTHEDLIPEVFKQDWYHSVDYLLAADYHEERGDMESARKLRRFVITHPYAWTKVEEKV